MTIDRNDPRWTQYVFEEMDAEEQYRFEREIGSDPEADAILSEIREAACLIEAGFKALPEASAQLSPSQRHKIVAAVEPVTSRWSLASRWSWAYASGIAAVLLLGVGVLMAPDPLRPIDPLIAPQLQTSNASEIQPQVLEPVSDTGVTLPGGSEPASLASNETPEVALIRSEDPIVGSPGPGEPTGVTPDRRLERNRVVGDEFRDDSVEASQTTPSFAEVAAELAFRNAETSKVEADRLNSSVAGAAVVDQVANAFVASDREQERRAGGASPALDRVRQQGFNTEEYTRIVDNAFAAVSEKPLATFSIDVDTASYANVRRFLNQRTLPPPDAVRIEEMINYFSYDYAPPVDSRPVRVHPEVAAAPWAPQHRLVRIGIKGQDISMDERAPSNLVFLIDVSGSMNDRNKLPLLKEGLGLLVDQLEEDDRVAIAVYAGASGLVLPSTPGHRKQRISAALDRLSAGGSTNGGAGIQLAYDTAVENFIDGGINRVILATDGDFNVGVTHNGALTRLIEEKARTGVFLSVLGFGTGNLNDAGLEALADQGNGNYAYIDSIREARKVLVEEIGGTLVTIAKDVKFQIEFNPAEVSAYRLIGYENRVLENQDFNDDTVDAGEIGAGHTVTALFEVVPNGVEIDIPGIDPLRYQSAANSTDQSESGEMLTVKIRYKAPDSEVSQLIEVPLRDRGQQLGAASEDYRFASAVAAFGMILRDSPHKGTASFDAVIEIATNARGRDEGGYRGEFLDLVRRARAIRDLGSSR